MTTVVIAEKPVVAREIKEALGPREGLVYTNCAGHLLELVEPAELEAKWGKPWKETVDELPLAFKPWPKRIVKGKEELVEKIRGLLTDAEVVIHAGDADEEGQLIVDEVLEYLGYTGPVKRVYVNSLVAADIQAAFERLVDNKDCMGEGKSALARQVADATFGFNETRAATVALGALANVGRVQTPTLGLVVARDRAIAGHVKERYQELYILLDLEGEKTYKEVPFKYAAAPEVLEGGEHIMEKDAEAIFERVRDRLKNALACDATVKERSEQPPLPYNTTELQRDMAKRYKLTPAKVMEVTQTLRDKHKAITYNRTDSRYLPQSEFQAAEETLKAARANLTDSAACISWPLDYTLHSKCFNDENTTAHCAIIPTLTHLEAAALTADEYTVYQAIVERYAMQFLPPRKVKESLAAVRLDNLGELRHKATQELAAGYKAYVKAPDKDADEVEEESSAVFVEQGGYRAYPAGERIQAKETKPPKPYTYATLLADMSSVAKYVEDEQVKAALLAKDKDIKGESGSIGTSATRADIIDGLVRGGWLEASAKGRLTSSEKGRALYDALPEAIKLADTTGLWWLMQEQVAQGKLDPYAIEDSVVAVFKAHQGWTYGGLRLDGRKTVGACPRCKAKLVDGGKVITCSSNKNERQPDGTWKQVSGCGFRLWRTQYGHKLTDKEVTQLVEGGKTTAKLTFKSKAGKPYKAYLALNDQTGEVNLVFDDQGKQPSR